MSQPSTRPSAAATDRPQTDSPSQPDIAIISTGSSQGSGQHSVLRSESMLRANPSHPDDIRLTSTTHSLTRPPGPSWHAGDAPGYQIPGHPSFHDSQHSALLMGNKHALPVENVRSHAPPPSAPGNPDRESIERTSRPKEEGGGGSGGGGGGSASNASSGVGSESPEKNSPGLVRSSETAEWLAQIGSGQLHHGRPVVTVGVTLPSSSITQGIPVSAVSSSDPRHYYSPKDSVYTSAPLGPVSVQSLQYSTHVTPSKVHLTTVPSYSPYLSPYALPYLGYPHSALTPGIESYSAMLASMGNQVQQAQAHLPTSPFLTPGIAVPSPYTPLGIQGLNPTAKSGLPESAASAVAYIGGHVIPTPSLLPTSHALSTGILSTGGLGGGHIPGVSIKTEDRQDHSQNKELEQHRQEQELKRYMDSGVKHPGPREARVSPFERRTSPVGSKSDQVKTGRDSGIPESPRQPGMELSPSGKVDSRQQYYREIGIGTVKLESGNGHAAQTYLSSSRPEVHGLHREHTHGPDGIRTHAVGKSTVISRTPPIASPIPSTLHMTSRLISSRQQQHSPQTGLVLSPTPQVRPTPSITTSLQPTTQHQGSTAIQQDFASPAQSRPDAHRFVSTVQDNQEQRNAGSDQSLDARHLSQSPLTNVPSYFTRGSIIQLANGELRRVEDLRTEDFVQSAEVTEGLKIDSSTVLRVEEDHRRGVAHIGFLVGEQKAQVTVEAPMEHPFFVFGQGWSAVQPERSLKSYGLACHPLAVGDVCVSLTVKENGRQPSLRKERVVESFHIGRDIAREPEAKRIRTEISLQQSPVEKAPPAQSAYHRQITEGSFLSNHIPGYPGHLISHSSFQAGIPGLGLGSSGEHSAAQLQDKIIERVDVDKNANTVLVQTNVVMTTSTSSGKQSPHAKLSVSERQIARPLKRRWSDPVKAVDPSPQKETLPSPVHPETLMKQSGGH